MSFRMIQSVFTFDKLLQRLQLGKEETPFVIWHEKDLFGTHDNPVKIDIPCFFCAWTERCSLTSTCSPIDSTVNTCCVSSRPVPAVL